jgi:hypothetical protein
MKIFEVISENNNMIHIGLPDDYTDDVWMHRVFINGKLVTSGEEFELNGENYDSVDAFIRALSKKFNVPEDSFDLYELDDDGKNPKLFKQNFKPRDGVQESPTGYGMRDGDGMGMSNASRRQGQANAINQTKRMNNLATDQGREANISARAQNRRINRLSKKIPTGLPQRILNPQQAQAPEQQS